MWAQFLIPRGRITANGFGPALALGEARGKWIELTLVIERVIEQQSLAVKIEGSQDGQTWGEKGLIEFPQKFYEGASVLRLDLGAYPDVKYLRASWKVNRWGRGEPVPQFDAYLFGEAVSAVALDSR
jgi:hypothetical protein